MADANWVLGTVAFCPEELCMKLLPQAEEELPREAYFEEPTPALGMAILIVVFPHLATGIEAFALRPAEGIDIVCATTAGLEAAVVFMLGLTTAPVRGSWYRCVTI